MRCCWTRALSVLPLSSDRYASSGPACGLSRCANAACPQRRAATGAGNDSDVLVQLLQAAPLEHPDPDQLTRQILSRLHRDGLIAEQTHPPLVPLRHRDAR